MGERSLLGELALALAAGAATWAGIRLAQRLEDPYAEPRLTVRAWLDRIGGGDPS